MFYNPNTSTLYRTGREARREGMNAENCEAQGFFVPTTAAKPDLAPNQSATLDAVPTLTGADYVFAWTVTATTPTVAHVRAEAARRILAIAPEWKQRNLTAQAAILAEKGRDNWTAAEEAAWTAGSAIWASVAVIRTASDVIEALDPIPNDYWLDSRWTA